jgi:hypothetical protein
LPKCGNGLLSVLLTALSAKELILSGPVDRELLDTLDMEGFSFNVIALTDQSSVTVASDRPQETPAKLS